MEHEISQDSSEQYATPWSMVHACNARDRTHRMSNLCSRSAELDYTPQPFYGHLDASPRRSQLVTIVIRHHRLLLYRCKLWR